MGLKKLLKRKYTVEDFEALIPKDAYNDGVYILEGFKNKADYRSIRKLEKKSLNDALDYAEFILNRTKTAYTMPNIIGSFAALEPNVPFILAMDGNGLWNFHIFFHKKVRMDSYFSLLSKRVNGTNEEYAEHLNLVFSQMLSFGTDVGFDWNEIEDWDYMVSYQEYGECETVEPFMTKKQAEDMAIELSADAKYSRIIMTQAIPVFIPVEKNGVIEYRKV